MHSPKEGSSRDEAFTNEGEQSGVSRNRKSRRSEDQHSTIIDIPLSESLFRRSPKESQKEFPSLIGAPTWVTGDHSILDTAILEDPLEVKSELEQALGWEDMRGTWMPLEESENVRLESKLRRGSEQRRGSEHRLESGHLPTDIQQQSATVQDLYFVDESYHENIPMSSLEAGLRRPGNLGYPTAGPRKAFSHGKTPAQKSSIFFELKDAFIRLSDRVSGRGVPASLENIETFVRDRSRGLTRFPSNDRIQTTGRISFPALAPVGVSLPDVTPVGVGVSQPEIAPISPPFTLTQTDKGPKQNHFFREDSINSSFNDFLSQKHSAAGTKLPASQAQIYGKSLCIFGPDSRLRIWCYAIATNQYTSTATLALLVLQAILLAYSHWLPVDDDAGIWDFGWEDVVLVAINAIYAFELLIKIIAFGLFNDKVMFETLGFPYPQSYVLSTGVFILKAIQKAYLSWLTNRQTELPYSTVRKRSRASVFGKYSTFFTIDLNDSTSSTLDTDDKETQSSTGAKRVPRQLSEVINARRKVQEMGLQRAFLRLTGNRLDLISVVSFWLSIFLIVNGTDAKNNIRLFRALGTIRILRLSNLSSGTNVLLSAFQSALPQLIDVGIFITCFWCVFAIIGVEAFNSSFSRHCVWTNPLDSSETYTTEQHCGSYLGTDGVVYPFLQRLGVPFASVKGFTCPVNSVCRSGHNPYDGTVSFDNFFQSMQLIFVVISVNGFSELMYDMMAAESIYASLFFAIAVFILAIWLINIFIAVIVSSFKITRTEMALSKKQDKKSPFRFWTSGVPHYELLQDLLKRKPWLKLYYRFEFIFIVCIFISLIFQSFRTFEMSQNRENVITVASSVFSVIFLVEILLRFGVHLPEWRIFFKSKQNCVDLFLAIITSVMAVPPVRIQLGQAYAWMTCFQIVRFYRVVLAVRVTGDLVTKLMKSIMPIFSLALFYFNFVCLTGIIMATYFQGTAPYADVEEVSFGMFGVPNAILTLFVITTTEGWASIMYQLQQYAQNTFQRSVGSIFIIIWFLLSNSIVLNIFIAVISQALDVSEESRRRHQLQQFISDMTKKLSTVRVIPGPLSKIKSKIFKGQAEKNVEATVMNLLLSGGAVNEFLVSEGASEPQEDIPAIHPPKHALKDWFNSVKKKIGKKLNNPFFRKHVGHQTMEDFDPAKFASQVISARHNLVLKQDQYLKENPSFNTVLYMLKPNHKIRRLCQTIVPSSHGERIDGRDPDRLIHDIFSLIMLITTITMVVLTCYSTPVYRQTRFKSSGTWNWTVYVDLVFLAIFFVEFIIKILADGVVFTPNAYARSPWNWLDFCAFFSLLMEFIAIVYDDGYLSKFVRGLKATRALRLLTISETAQNNFHYTMISGFGKIFSAGLVSVALIYPFSIWGLNVFNGRLGVCSNGDFSRSECVDESVATVFEWNVLSPNVYSVPSLAADLFGDSFSTFYQIVSLEGWSDFVISVMLSTGIGTPAEIYSHPFNGFLVILFICVSMIFILTLFVSVILNNYAKLTGRAYLTEFQIQWYHIKKYLANVKASKRVDTTQVNWLRRFCHRMVVERSIAWRSTTNVALLLQVFGLVLETFPEIVSLESRYILFVISTTCLVSNQLMFLIAQGYQTFFSNFWSVFLLLLTFGAWVTTIAAFITFDSVTLVLMNKLFLAALLLFLFPRSDRVNQLLRFTSASFPSLFSLMFTWLVIFLVYGIAMNQIFGLTKFGSNSDGLQNFRTVPRALILLFRCSFGENWNYIMKDYTLEAPYCVSSTLTFDSDCGNKAFAYFFFCSWNLISMYIMLNLYVSLVVDTFSYIAGGSQYAHLIERNEIRSFKRCWNRFDPKGTGFIDPKDLTPLLDSLEGSLSLPYRRYFSKIPDLQVRWISKDILNPYRVNFDLDEINGILAENEPEIRKAHKQRKTFELFVQEAILSMELHDEPGISFTRLLLQIPLYSNFDTDKCLILIDYLERRLFLNKLERRINRRRALELLEGHICRWRYKQWKRGEILAHELVEGSEKSAKVRVGFSGGYV